MNRRVFIAGGALVFAGCGKKPGRGPHEIAVARNAVAIDYASYYAPYPDFKRLVAARAAKLGAQLNLSDDPAGVKAQMANLTQWTGKRGGFNAVAVAAFDVAAVETIAKDTEVKLIALLTEFAGQAAAVTVDYERAARQLVANAPQGPVLLIGPPPNPAVPDPFAPGFAAAAKALAGLTDVVATVPALAAADAAAAIAGAPKSLSIFCWNDTTALGAATAAPNRFVGALTAPAISSPDTLKALKRGTLGCVVTPRLSDFANAVVDLTHEYARGDSPGNRKLPLRVLTPDSDTRAFAGDYGSG